MIKKTLLLLLLLVMVGTISCTATPAAETLEPTSDLVAVVPTATDLIPTNTPSPAATIGPPASVTPVSTSTATATATASPTATATATNTPTATPTETLTPTVTVTPPNRAKIPELSLVPGSPQPYLSQFRLVSYYGTPNGPSLGVLGAQPRYYTVRILRTVAQEYKAYTKDDRFVIPTFHIITTVADEWPGQDGNYNHWLDWGVILDWIEVAKEEQMAVVLDIQPGRADVMEEFERLWGLLYEPHVHLAIDPEFLMYPDETPGQQIGQISAEQINAVQARMNAIGYEIGLNRVLIIHQFEDEMILNKEQIQNYPFVELVIDADGYGSPGTKIFDYNQYRNEPGFEYGGFKLFYDWDTQLMTPEEVMSLSPTPSIIIYQ